MNDLCKLKRFSLIDGLLFSLNLAVNIVSYSVIATLPGYGEFGVIFTTLMIAFLYLAIEFPTSLIADKFSWLNGVVAGQFFKMLSQIFFILSVQAALIKDSNSIYIYLLLTTLFDSIGSSLTSGSYESVFLTWYNNSKSNLFIDVFTHHIWARIVPSIAIICFTIAIFYLGKPEDMRIVFVPLLVLLVYRAIIAITIYSTVKSVKNKRKEGIRTILKGVANDLLKTSNQIVIYSAFKFFRLIASGILISYLYKLLVNSGFTYQESWSIGTLTTLFIYYLSIYLNKKLFPFFIGKESKIKSIISIFNYIFIILGSALVISLFNQTSVISYFAQVFLSLILLVSTGFVLSYLKSNLKELISTDFSASWISFSESIGLLYFIGFSIIVYVFDGQYAVEIFCIAIVLIALIVNIFCDKNLVKVKLFSFKKLMSYGNLVLITVIMISFGTLTLSFTYKAMKESQVQHLQLNINRMSILLKEDMLNGSFTNIKSRAVLFLEQKDIDCIKIEYQESEIFNSCKTKDNSSIGTKKEIHFEGSVIGNLEVFYNLSSITKTLIQMFVNFLIFFIIILIIAYLGVQLISSLLYREIHSVLYFKTEDGYKNYTLEFNRLKEQVLYSFKEKLDLNRKNETLKLATQVAHDIKSPLAALEIVMDDIRDLPEDSRELTLNAINRIQEIANNLSKDGRASAEKDETCLISNTIQMTINEKRFEYQGQKGIKIDFIDETDHMQFIGVNSTELARIVSNLINNATQALSGAGNINLKLAIETENLVFTIKDSGQGFPESMFNKPIERGNTIGKEGGQGLGLHHAFETITAAGGEFKIFNNGGAVIEMIVPILPAPNWFNPKINLDGVKEVVIIDDDNSIHSLWKKVLKTNNAETRITHIKKQDEIEFALSDLKDDQLILIDYDLRLNKTGIDYIQEYNLKNVVLVTSSYENSEIKDFCTDNSVQLLPKYLISKVKY